MKPKLSVLMPVYNGEKYIHEAIDSILSQTFADFEFVIIDDASTDRSVDVIRSFGDPRILFLQNDSNLGLIATLNRGLDTVSGEYVARMDQDDVSLPERFAKQVVFMDSNPKVAASGTWARDIDEGGRIIGRRPHVPVGRQMENDFWHPSPMIHPSVMIRLEHLGNVRYNPEAIHAEDYDLWLSLKKKHQLDNLPEYLLLYRVHPESITRMNPQDQAHSAHQILCRQTGLQISYEEFLELLGAARELNPIRRVLLTRRLAKTLRRPYRRYLRQDLEYARSWMRPLKDRMKSQIQRSLYHAYRQIKPSREP
jgi:glycosyltransferase involved in cell wall biosynthesis